MPFNYIILDLRKYSNFLILGFALAILYCCQVIYPYKQLSSINAPYDDVLQIVKEVIQRNYNIIQFDETAGVIVTDWYEVLSMDIEPPQRFRVEAKVEKQGGLCTVGVRVLKEQLTAQLTWVPVGNDEALEDSILSEIQARLLGRRQK